MTFIWPSFLWLLLLLPLLWFAYAWMSRRQTARFSPYQGLQQQSTAPTGWRRKLPPLLMMLALASMLFAVSRPVSVITLPSHHETIMLAIDLSGSMRATDIEPSRLEVAQQAIRDFIDDVPYSTRVGIVAFGATAATIQAPTSSRDQLNEAIDRFKLRQGTAIGSGIKIALKTLFPKMVFDEKKRRMPRMLRDDGVDLTIEPEKETEQEQEAKEPGSHKTAAIVLLSDGQNNAGPDPLKLALKAASRGVRVYTVGFGTEEGAVIGAQGRSMRVKLDEKTLKLIADITEGEYFQAGSASELSQVYENLTSKLVFEKKRTEVSSMFALLGALLAMLAAGFSLFWFNRIF